MKLTLFFLYEQVAYVALVGSFPFNSFLSGVLSCIGTAVLAGKCQMCITFCRLASYAYLHTVIYTILYIETSKPTRYIWVDMRLLNLLGTTHT